LADKKIFSINKKGAILGKTPAPKEKSSRELLSVVVKRAIGP
jgi:hypothetical protein